MRFALGLVIGVLLTVGFAYTADSFHSAPGADGKEAPRMVNWGVVSTNMHELSDDVQDGWRRLVGGSKRLEGRSGT